jgi:excinuclease UvrABC nuclease subunit
LAQARDQAAHAMQFEQAQRCHRDLEALAALADRTLRLSRVVTENNLVILLGDSSNEAALSGMPVAYVVLSGRLTLVRQLDSREAASSIAQFINANYELYRLRPVLRSELEAMTIVARWLKERSPADGEIIPIRGPMFDADRLRVWLPTIPSPVV